MDKESHFKLRIDSDYNNPELLYLSNLTLLHNKHLKIYYDISFLSTFHQNSCWISLITLSLPGCKWCIPRWPSKRNSSLNSSWLGTHNLPFSLNYPSLKVVVSPFWVSKFGFYYCAKKLWLNYDNTQVLPQDSRVNNFHSHFSEILIYLFRYWSSALKDTLGFLFKTSTTLCAFPGWYMMFTS